MLVHTPLLPHKLCLLIIKAVSADILRRGSVEPYSLENVHTDITTALQGLPKLNDVTDIQIASGPDHCGTPSITILLRTHTLLSPPPTVPQYPLPLIMFANTMAIYRAICTLVENRLQPFPNEQWALAKLVTQQPDMSYAYYNISSDEAILILPIVRAFTSLASTLRDGDAEKIETINNAIGPWGKWLIQTFHLGANPDIRPLPLLRVMHLSDAPLHALTISHCEYAVYTSIGPSMARYLGSGEMDSEAHWLLGVTRRAQTIYPN